MIFEEYFKLIIHKEQFQILLRTFWELFTNVIILVAGPKRLKGCYGSAQMAFGVLP